MTTITALLSAAEAGRRAPDDRALSRYECEGTGTLTDEDHVWQSVNDILLTPVNTRMMRRNYGSLCPDLIDSPQNDVTRLQLMSAAVIALAAWEPRIALDAINMTILLRAQ
jgi:phage baseplate assembly protein W